MILVVGGAGYIGSHFCKMLRQQGVAHTVFDSLEKGHRAALGEGNNSSPLIQSDLRDADSIRAALRDLSGSSGGVAGSEGVTAVVHFAAYIEVGESMAEPERYRQNNVEGTRNLLQAMSEAGVGQIVFSSTAAVYGEPTQVPIPEDHPLQPTSVYGETKLEVERMLEGFEREHGIRSVRLRYFNASGADPEGELGEDHRPETHLIPRALLAALGRVPPLKLFGTDYPTPDGTCVRDYVHVWDLARAHLLALGLLGQGKSAAGEFVGGAGTIPINLGSGRGFSVREVLEAASRVSGRDVPYEEAARREGDPAVLVASNERAKSVLGWEPQLDDLDTIVRHAWNWLEANPQGYSD